MTDSDYWQGALSGLVIGGAVWYFIPSIGLWLWWLACLVSAVVRVRQWQRRQAAPKEEGT